MAPDRSSPQNTFNLSLLDPQALDAPDGLVLRAIETVCHGGNPEIAGIVDALNSGPYALEYIISGALRVPVVPCALPSTDYVT